MCEPTTLAIMAVGSSLMGSMQQKAAIQAGNRAKGSAFALNTQAGMTSYKDQMGQLSEKTNQELEAASQQSRKVQSGLSDYIGKAYSGSAGITGNTILAVAQGAAAKKGEADAAILRNKDMLALRHYQEGGVRSHKVWSQIMAGYQQPQAPPSGLGMIVSAAASGISTYASAEAAGIGSTTAPTVP